MSTQLPAEVGDNDFWILAKQCAALGYTPQAGDNAFTLQSRLVGLQGGGSGRGGGGIPEAPTDGNLYGRENASWVEVPPVPPSTGVQKTGDTMTGTLVIADPGGGGATILDVYDSTNSRYVKLYAQGTIYLSAGGTQTNLTSDGSGNLSIGGGHGIILSSGYPATTVLTADTTTGDIIATAIAGPNAGKSVNLTAGKWA